jgi:hypothetical protein
MTDIESQSSSHGCFMGYFPDRSGKEFHAMIDGNSSDLELQRALYERVSQWTKKHGIILGEGVTWSYENASKELPKGMGMIAPVQRSASSEITYEMFYPEES